MTKNRKLQYKQTPIGLIPEDWEVKKLGELGTFFSGGTPLTSKKEYYNGNIPFIKSGEIYYDKTEQFITQEALNNSSAKMVSIGDLLYALYGANSGEVAISKLNGAINQAILCIKPPKILNTYFIYNFLLDKKETIITSYLQGGQGNLSAEIIKNLLIPLPPLPEQQKIATILSTWDTAIDKCKAIIKKLKERNKGLARVLLSGKMRVKGFEGTNDNNYKNLSRFIHEVSIRNTDLKVNKVLSVTNARGFINQLEQFDREVASSDLRNYKIVKKGQFAYNPSRVNVGSLDLLINFNEGILSPMYIVFEANNKLISSKFLYYHLKSYWFIRHIPMFVQGSVRDSLSFDGLSSIKFFIPSIEEQQSIANILDTAVAELNNYEQKLLILQQQKKGLMQQLLTGKRRIKTII